MKRVIKILQKNCYMDTMTTILNLTMLSGCVQYVMDSFIENPKKLSRIKMTEPKKRIVIDKGYLVHNFTEDKLCQRNHTVILTNNKDEFEEVFGPGHTRYRLVLEPIKRRNK